MTLAKGKEEPKKGEKREQRSLLKSELLKLQKRKNSLETLDLTNLPLLMTYIHDKERKIHSINVEQSNKGIKSL